MRTLKKGPLFFETPTLMTHDPRWGTERPTPSLRWTSIGRHHSGGPAFSGSYRRKAAEGPHCGRDLTVSGSRFVGPLSLSCQVGCWLAHRCGYSHPGLDRVWSLKEPYIIFLVCNPYSIYFRMVAEASWLCRDAPSSHGSEAKRTPCKGPTTGRTNTSSPQRIIQASIRSRRCCRDGMRSGMLRALAWRQPRRSSSREGLFKPRRVWRCRLDGLYSAWCCSWQKKQSAPSVHRQGRRQKKGWPVLPGSVGKGWGTAPCSAVACSATAGSAITGSAVVSGVVLAGSAPRGSAPSGKLCWARAAGTRKGCKGCRFAARSSSCEMYWSSVLSGKAWPRCQAKHGYHHCSSSFASPELRPRVPLIEPDTTFADTAPTQKWGPPKITDT